jgi:DNA polymerase/3'-5' exonuclease PolX
MPPLNEMYRLGMELVEALSPGCVRIALAGSVRREKPSPNDIEVVCIPSIETFTINDMFGEEVERVTANRLDDALEQTMGEYGPWVMDDVTKRNGEKYKRLRTVGGVGGADVFITDARRWGYTYTVRTGPGEFSKAIVTRAHQLGMFFSGSLLHQHKPLRDELGNVLPCARGERCRQIIETPEEVDVFTALDLPYILPQKRSEMVGKFGYLIDLSLEVRSK